MNNFRSILIVCIALLMVSCTAQYSKSLFKQTLEDGYILDRSDVSTTRQWVLPSKTRFYVAFPEGQWSIPLRRKLTSDLAGAMRGVFVDVGYADDSQSLHRALQAAAEYGAPFLIYPQLAVYSNKLSSFVEIDEDFEDYRQVGFDRLLLLLKMYDTKSHRLIDVTQIGSRSGVASIQRATPSSLFGDAFLSYADSLVMKSVK